MQDLPSHKPPFQFNELGMLILVALIGGTCAIVRSDAHLLVKVFAVSTTVWICLTLALVFVSSIDFASSRAWRYTKRALLFVLVATALLVAFPAGRAWLSQALFGAGLLDSQPMSGLD